MTGWLGGYNFQWAWASGCGLRAGAWPRPAVDRLPGTPLPAVAMAIIAALLANPDGLINFQLGNPGREPDLLAAHFEIHGFMTTIRVKENEPFDVALRRFKRTIEKLGLLTELRAREFYEKPTAERKRKKAAAVKRHYKRVRSMQLPKKLY